MKKINKNSNIFNKNSQNLEKEKDLVQSIIKDYEARKEERKPFEAQWQLNINFLMGNQYCGINANDMVDDFEKQYFWQEREVYNHIAPIIETRLAKLNKVKPEMTVQPASGDDEDVSNAKVCKDILSSVSVDLGLSKIISQATKWSEICGTSFYKLIWNDKAGVVIGTTLDNSSISEGNVEVLVCPPFEIFPDSNSSENVESCRSIIHARAYHIDDIKQIWGVDVEGEDIDTYNLTNSQIAGGLGYLTSVAKVGKTVKHNHAMVIERYEKPTIENPNGRLLIVAGDKLIFDGELPYKNGRNGERGLPFIQQISVEQPALFWGASIIDRMIPVQRAYNAVKNRKHEFMNRISMGVLAVEDGSVDIDNLEDEGLSPGKILVYRQGSNAPKMMSSESVPVDFSNEESKLLEEFMEISGVNDLLINNVSSLGSMSGVALELLIEQDETKITATGENIRFAIKNIGQGILRLYKQFANTKRLGKVLGQNGELGMFYWDKTNITSDDVVFETKNEIGETVAQRRSMIFDLLKAGLLHDENGKLSNAMRLKVLQMLGFGVWEDALDSNALQINCARRENLEFLQNVNPEVLEIHDHDLHIATHTAFMLSSEFEKISKQDKKIQDSMLNHIRMHKQFQKLSILASLQNKVNEEATK